MKTGISKSKTEVEVKDINRMTYVIARYNLYDCVSTAISYNLNLEEMFSLVFTECNFKKTTDAGFMLGLLLCGLHYKKDLDKLKNE